MIFNNGSNCPYHFIIKELAEDFKGQYTSLGESTEIFQFQWKKK